MAELSNIKGAFDNPPREMALRNHVIGVLRKNFESFGYLPLETASLNYLSLLTNKYDPNAEIVREIYKIRDQGDRDLGLRFDLTVPFAKFIANNPTMKMPFKRYEIGKVWRNGPVKSGRAREFYQCDADAVGINGVQIESEIITLAVKCYTDLGITPVIKYGHRALLPYSDAVIAIIDKMAKVTHAELIKELSTHMSPIAAEKLIVDVKNAPKCPELVELERVLKSIPVPSSKKTVFDFCEYAPYLARGLNIYTGVVFEAFAKNSSMTSSMGGGGRYDKIIGNLVGRGEYPAVGIGFGLEPIMAVLNEQLAPKNGATTQNGNPMLAPMIDILLIPEHGTETITHAIANQLRTQGKRVLVYLGGKPEQSNTKIFHNGRDYASTYGIPTFAVISPEITTLAQLTFRAVKQ